VLLGALTRVGALCIIIVMLGAIFTVHLPHGFNVVNNGMEYALTQLLIGVALLIVGPGEYSLARILPESLRGL
jgi:putative oxidoreductase